MNSTNKFVVILMIADHDDIIMYIYIHLIGVTTDKEYNYLFSNNEVSIFIINSNHT